NRQVASGPIVEEFQAWLDDPGIEELSYPMFAPQIRREVLTERIAVGKHPGKRQEYARHAEERVAGRPARGGPPAERRPGRGDQRVGVENPHQYHVDEEPLDAGLAACEPLVVEVCADDAEVVRPIPSLGRRAADELEQRGDRRGAGCAGMTEG